MTDPTRRRQFLPASQGNLRLRRAFSPDCPRGQERDAPGGADCPRANGYEENTMKLAKILAASAAVALVTGMGAAVAQQEPSRSAPAEKTAPGGKQPSAIQHQNEGSGRNEGQNSRAGQAQ